MVVKLASQVVDDPLTDPRRPPPLQDPDKRVEQRQSDDPETQETEQTEVLFGERDVDQAPREDRGQHAQGRDQ